MRAGRPGILVVGLIALTACGSTVGVTDGGLDATGVLADARPERVLVDAARDRDVAAGDGGMDAEACGLAPARPVVDTQDGGPVAGSLYGDSRVQSSFCAPHFVTEGPEDVYSFHLDVPSYVRMTARPDHLDSSAPPFVVSFRRTCDGGATEISCGARELAESGADEHTSETAAGLEPGDYVAVVDVADYGIGDAYTYSFAASPLGPGTDACIRARRFASGFSLPAETFTTAVRMSVPCLDGGFPRYTRYYRVTVPPGAAMNALAETGGVGVRLALLEDCDSPQCPISSGSSPTGGAMLFWVNDAPDPVDRVLAVQPLPALSPPTSYQLTVSVGGGLPNASCDSPTPLVDGGSYNDNASRAPDSVVDCATGETHAHLLYYAGTIPPASFLGLVEVSNGASLSAVRVPSCPAPAGCLDVAEVPPSGYFVANPGPDPSALLVALSPADGAGVSFSTVVLPLPTNVTCDAAAPIASGTSQDAYLAPSSGPVDTACGTLPGAQFYRVTVPARGTLSVQLRSLTDPLPVRVYFLSGCASGDACLGSPDADAGSLPGVATYTNDLDVSRDVVVAIAGDLASVTPVKIDVSAQRLDFVELSVPTACDDLTGAPALTFTHISGATNPIDDASTDVLPLPFPFPYFGETETHFTAFTNGLMQLFPAANGVPILPSSSVSLWPLPSAGAPRRAVAPLWTDLLGLDADAGTSVLRGQLSAPDADAGGERHYTLEWAGWSFYFERDAVATFQVKLFESGAIEFHYCSIRTGPSPDGTETGSGASIGVQDATGTRGAQHSFRQAGSISTASAIRFVPLP